MSRSRVQLAIALALIAPIGLVARQATQPAAGSKTAPAAQKKTEPAMPEKKGEMKGMEMKKSSMTDARKIASAEGAAPAEISKHATIMDWPDKEGAPMKQLRAGTNGWMCTPEGPSPSMPAGCMDKQWQAWVDALVKKAAPKITGAGVAYMLRGDHGASNTDPNATGPTATNQWVVSPPHVMLLMADARMLDAFSTDPKTGGPWVMWKGTPYAHVMVPISKTEMAKMGAEK